MFCVNCGKEFPQGGKFCPYCGAKTADPTTPSAAPQTTNPIPQTTNSIPQATGPIPQGSPQSAPSTPSEPVRKEEGKRPGGVVASIFLTVFLSLVGLLMVPTLFLHTFSGELGAVRGTFAGKLLGSVFPAIFVGVIAFLLVVGLFIVNRRRVRRGFLCCGVAFAAMGVGSIALALFARLLLTFIADPWQGILSSLCAAFCDVELFLGVCLAVFGFLLMSIYACIGAIRREGTEAV